MELQALLNQYKPLNQREMNAFIELLISEDVKDEVKIEYLTSFSEKEITQEELTYIVKSLIHSMYDQQPYYPNSMCVCGTGGDKSNSFNISTTVSFVIASANVPVIKHGNKSVTSSSGSTDLLNAMQIQTTSVEQTPSQLDNTGLAFLSATETYPIMKQIQPIRKHMSNPTIFNITGPIINPFKLDYQVMGVYETSKLDKIAQTLADLGRKKAIVVYGANGMDEATLSGDNIIYEVNANESVKTYTLNANDVGLDYAPNEELIGGTPAENLEITKNILNGTDRSAKRDVVVLNAGIALYVSEQVSTIQEGVSKAQKLIDEGEALAQYNKMGGKTYDYIG
ncbi:anthranilate phosphoribosyltransferase [Staphylococcus xylosus]|uniref:Anthranilate phosphoribosyltransferase n=1 Tax=Staphylococcus xylosus TaxID=1288 RepID=A0A5R9B6M8_STAXY|nr:anthranilate phosphoribosyltransferase [Staphylococcus xylosus]AID42846.1 Anthranilate phosphoribosyltransferase [Staphylococcus xylosus]MBE6180960.1 anthranilate phosphoribosyltransferase [Staphylococcus xylosus]MCE4993636.1 anthranilate phosphoribosyltransferase [Staphylococcus xylosus]MCE7783632.1 anthranilate phosphoribosyltransferase [Staphylococcus xylosus]MCI8278721.1 anthranilate phosphoribosyltransferase [Staphylococcus xylosus]